MASFSNNRRLTRVQLFNQIYDIDSSKKEIVVILLSGCIKVNNQTISRKDVFSEKAKGFYLVNSGICSLESVEHAEICIIESESSYVITALNSLSSSITEINVPLTMIDEESIKLKRAGSKNFSREVMTIVDKDSGVTNLIIGETIKPGGNWSSWPPHKHDTYIPSVETAQEEIYLYKFSQKNGFGVQILYDKNLVNSKAYIVTENQEIKISKGYHPVVAAPHCDMYYLWVLFGSNKEFNVSFDEAYHS